MKAIDIMPRPVSRELERLGRGIAIARRRRRIPVALMLERTGLAKRTYQQVEKGDPSVAMAAYAMALHALGMSTNLGLLADPERDASGMLIEIQSLPKRVHAAKAPR